MKKPMGCDIMHEPTNPKHKDFAVFFIIRLAKRPRTQQPYIWKMADSEESSHIYSEESDTSSIDGGPVAKVTSPGQVEQLNKRIESLQQENRVLKMELETYKLRCKTLQEENRELRKASVTIVSCLLFFVYFEL